MASATTDEILERFRAAGALLDGHFRLKDALDRVKDQYDYIVIDTPPTLGLITVNALVASTHVLIPIQSSYFALEGTVLNVAEIKAAEELPNDCLLVEVEQHAVGAGSGVPVEMALFWLFGFADGKVTRFHMYGSREAAVAAASG